jgi:hypothetical protein
VRFCLGASRLMECGFGRRVLPMSDECEGFDYQTGCPGHEYDDGEE